VGERNSSCFVQSQGTLFPRLAYLNLCGESALMLRRCLGRTPNPFASRS
jgi:hypothetical protein